jgi:hypothetical protein
MVMWAAVDDEETCETYEIQVIGTGCSIPSATAGYYLGTVLLDIGQVWHVFWIRQS